ncbi:MAG: hypothetical protein ACREHV_12075, partial [Rhizomicrobium sp.]
LQWRRERARATAVSVCSQRRIPVRKKLNDRIIPTAQGKKTPQADFDRNRDGLYGGLPKTRDPAAPGARAKASHPQRDPGAAHEQVRK